MSVAVVMYRLDRYFVIVTITFFVTVDSTFLFFPLDLCIFHLNPLMICRRRGRKTRRSLNFLRELREPVKHDLLESIFDLNSISIFCLSFPSWYTFGSVWFPLLFLFSFDMYNIYLWMGVGNQYISIKSQYWLHLIFVKDAE